MSESVIEQSTFECAERGQGILGGQWVFKGTRVPVAALYENLRDGASIDEFLEWFPGVTREQVTASLNSNRTVDIYELIERIRPRPALYLGSRSISRLDSFLTGYRCALDDLKVNGTPSFWYFHDWVAMKLGAYASTAGWCHLLLESMDGDEDKALDRFFSYLDEFKQRKATILFEGVPFSGCNWRSSVDPATGELTPLEKPVLVQILKYTQDKGVFLRYLGAEGNAVDREEYCQDIAIAYMRTESLVEKDAWTPPVNNQSPNKRNSHL
jgi:uncharacterized protein (DUF433 family)